MCVVGCFALCNVMSGVFGATRVENYFTSVVWRAVGAVLRAGYFARGQRIYAGGPPLQPFQAERGV